MRKRIVTPTPANVQARGEGWCGPFREIVRQQWNFSPPTSTRESEEYRVELSEVTVLELTIVPDISGGAARASLKTLHLS